MKNKTTIEKVEEFHTIFQPETLTNKPQLFLSLERRRLRIKLIYEELYELAIALGCESYLNSISRTHEDVVHSNEHIDMIEAIDALSDIQYVVDGTYLELGLKNLKEEAFDLVHKSNMSKACISEEEAQKTYDYYLLREKETVIVPINDYFVIRRKSDDKTLKSINYQPVDLKPLLKKYLNESNMERVNTSRDEQGVCNQDDGATSNEV